jgi:hypothetical protein
MIEFALEIEGSYLYYLVENNKISVLLFNTSPGELYIKKLPRPLLGSMIFGNFLPSEIIDSDWWSCDSEIVPFLDLLFPRLQGTVYPLDGF